MDKMKTVRGISKAGAILLKIAEIFSIIGAVGVLIGILALAFLPADLMEVEVTSDVKVIMNMADFLGRDTWAEAREYAAKSLSPAESQEIQFTDDGMEVTQNATKALTRGDLALSIAPSILTLAVTWFFCRTLGKTLRDIRDGGEPFRKEIAESLRACGIALFVGAAAPAVVYSAVNVFAQTAVSEGINLVMVFAGLMLFAVAALLEAAEARGIRLIDTPAAPPFAGYQGYAAAPQTPSAPTPAEPKSEEAPAPENKDDVDPNAF